MIQPKSWRIIGSHDEMKRTAGDLLRRFPDHVGPCPLRAGLLGEVCLPSWGPSQMGGCFISCVRFGGGPLRRREKKACTGQRSVTGNWVSLGRRKAEEIHGSMCVYVYKDGNPRVVKASLYKWTAPVGFEYIDKVVKPLALVICGTSSPHPKETVFASPPPLPVSPSPWHRRSGLGLRGFAQPRLARGRNRALWGCP